MGLVAIVVARFQEVVPAIQVVRPALVGSAALLLILLLKANRASWRRMFSFTTTRLLCAYVGWAAVTVPFAYWPGFAFTTVWGLLPVTAMFVAVIMCGPTRANLDRLQLAFVLALAVFAAGSLLWGPRVGDRVGGVGVTYDPNDMATVLAVGFPLAVGLAGRASGVRRLLLLAVILAFGAAVAASASRGGMVAFCVGAVVLAAGQRASRRMIYLGALALGAIVVWFSAGPVFRERAASLLSVQSDYNLQDERNGRVAVWKRGVTYFLGHPVLGVGAGNFEVAEGAALAARGELGRWSASHNAYIQAFADLGAVGGAVFLSLLGVSGWQARRLWRPPRSRLSPSFHRPELLAALSAFCVGALFLSFAYSGTLIGLVAFITLVTDTARAELGPARARVAPLAPAAPFWRSW
jgi:O-antigen ligase